MLHSARMSGAQEVARNVTNSNWVSPSVCVTRFSNDFGEQTFSDKNDRYWPEVFGSGFV
jgi:hypothetical protein